MLYDDVLNAAALIGVSGVIAAAILSVFPEPSQTAQVSIAKSQAHAAPAREASRKPVDVMPVYDLPRVVVTGHRSRDGDMMAATGAVAPIESDVPLRPRNAR